MSISGGEYLQAIPLPPHSGSEFIPSPSNAGLHPALVTVPAGLAPPAMYYDPYGGLRQDGGSLTGGEMISQGSFGMDPNSAQQYMFVPAPQYAVAAAHQAQAVAHAQAQAQAHAHAHAHAHAQAQAQANVHVQSESQDEADQSQQQAQSSD